MVKKRVLIRQLHISRKKGNIQETLMRVVTVLCHHLRRKGKKSYGSYFHISVKILLHTKCVINSRSQVVSTLQFLLILGTQFCLSGFEPQPKRLSEEFLYLICDSELFNTILSACVSQSSFINLCFYLYRLCISARGFPVLFST